ncbi:MAG: hypothetical protein RR908_06495, partial [Rikenellaceae bacterium]
MSNLSQIQSQKLLQKLSPQQIQMIKLLELPTLQLEQRIKKEIEENPALEEIIDSDNEDDTNINLEEYAKKVKYTTPSKVSRYKKLNVFMDDTNIFFDLPS